MLTGWSATTHTADAGVSDPQFPGSRRLELEDALTIAARSAA
jgi:hypothetical protein